jgi:hypothetical protein
LASTAVVARVSNREGDEIYVQLVW